jgi:SAM-dependent methyltransferase
MDDEHLLSTWLDGRTTATRGEEGFSSRGWYHQLYRPILKGCDILDVGSGFGIDALTFAENGARVTCLDILNSNLDILRRVSRQLLLDVNFAYLEDKSSIERLGDFDFIWCQGSMLHQPFELARQEAACLLEHLKDEGRWVELAYPETRWIREGRMPFEKWGDKTDGGSPWTEWYDLDKLRRRLQPVKFCSILNYEFHNSDFIWFDLKRGSE